MEWFNIPRNVLQEASTRNSLKMRKQLIFSNFITIAIVYQQSAAKLNRVLAPLDMNITQMSILSHFARQPDLQQTITELADVMAMNQPMVTKAVKSMSDAGLLARAASPTDARIVYVSITDAGQAAFYKAGEATLPVVNQLFDEIDDDELQLLTTMMGKLRRCI